MAEASDLHSRIEEIHKLCIIDEFEPLDSQGLLEECALHVQSRVDDAISEFSDFVFFGAQDFDTCLEKLNEELNKVDAESTKLEKEIELLTQTHKDDCHLLQAKLEEFKCSLDYVTSLQDQKTEEDSKGTDSPMLTDDHTTFTIANQGNNLEQLRLDCEIDEIKSNVKYLEALQCKVKWIDAVEQIEDMLAGLKVVAFDDNCIRLSLLTHMPKFEGLSHLDRVQDNSDVTELSHELLIEVFEGTLKLKNAQVFPNDIYVSDIIEAAKSVSKSSLQWFVIKMQERIILNRLRHLVVKDANKSRYMLEYLDKDETIVAHTAGGIDAYIKLFHGWPLFASPLTLISVRGSNNLKGTSLSFHGKVEKLANSLDSDIRQNISSFVDAIQNIIKEQLQFDHLA